MATINDVVNNQLARVMANHGAPLRALAEKEDRNEAMRAAALKEERDRRGRMDLLNAEQSAATARGLMLQKGQQDFLAQQNDLNQINTGLEKELDRGATAEEKEKDRKARLEEVKVQTAAMFDRMDAAKKADLYAKFPKKADETHEEYINRLAKHQAGSLTKLVKQQNELNAEMETLTQKETQRRLKTAEQVARGNIMLLPDVTGALGRTSTGKRITSEGMGFDKAVTTLRASKDKKDQALADSLVATLAQQADAELNSTDNGRFKIPESPEYMDRLKRIREQAATISMRLNKQYTAPDFIGEDQVDWDAGRAASSNDPIAVFGNILQNLNQKPAAAVAAPAATQPAAVAAPAAAPVSSGATGLGPAVGRAISSAAGAVRDFNRDYNTAPDARVEMEDHFQSTGNAIKRMAGLIYEPEGGFDYSIRHAPAQDITYGVTTPWEKQSIRQLFGEDAPGLMPEIARMASQNGVDKDTQVATYKAALGGNPDAIQKVSSMLDLVRQMKYSPDYVPVSDRAFSFQ